MQFLKKFFGRTPATAEHMPLYLSNTLTGKRDEFTPLTPGHVGMYNCGPTVYNYAHVGNLRAYVLADVLRRTLEWNGYTVKQVINITDVGHLTSDADEGADKLEEGAKREKKSVHDIIEMYTAAFFRDLDLLNIPRRDIIFTPATKHIPEQIDLIRRLEEKGLTYRTSDGVYFDTAKFPEYGKLGHVHIDEGESESRIGVNAEKRHVTDFALWKFSKPEDKREQEWQSPWGVGFPGWHIECSAMSMKYLGETFDIHTGGIDHIPVHHNNEIAQSESATGKPFARFWLHNAFVAGATGEKMAKSAGGFVRLDTLAERGIDPLAYRYWLLTAHYTTAIQFSFEALEAAQAGYKKLIRSVALLSHKHSAPQEHLKKEFTEIINNDLNTPGAIAFLWDLVKNEALPSEQIRATIEACDQVLGIDISGHVKRLVEKMHTIPGSVRELVHRREAARKAKDWATADKLRAEITATGFILEDSDTGPILMPAEAF